MIDWGLFLVMKSIQIIGTELLDNEQQVQKQGPESKKLSRLERTIQKHRRANAKRQGLAKATEKKAV